MNFSQNNEQEIILNYFKHQKEGTFLDIGANDGVTLSNTRALAINGWSGVCIEPGESAFTKLAQLYVDSKTVECFNLAITRFDGPIVLHESGSVYSHDTGLLSSCIYSETLKWKHETDFSDIVVDGVTWNSFFKNYRNDLFDFISIDAEGMDLEILFQMNLTGLGCKLLCIEWGENTAAKNAIAHYVSLFGMKLLAENQTNVIYGL